MYPYSILKGSRIMSSEGNKLLHDYFMYRVCTDDDMSGRMKRNNNDNYITYFILGIIALLLALLF